MKVIPEDCRRIVPAPGSKNDGSLHNHFQVRQECGHRLYRRRSAPNQPGRVGRKSPLPSLDVPLLNADGQIMIGRGSFDDNPNILHRAHRISRSSTSIVSSTLHQGRSWLAKLLPDPWTDFGVT